MLLGTGGMMPMPYRMLSSLAVRLNGEIYLFDAGEGTQLGWKKLGLGVRGMRLIALTHLHADHCLGLPGLMMLKAQMPDPGPLTILGPPGTKEFVLANLKILAFYLNYPVHFVEWSEGQSEEAYEDERVKIIWQPVLHTRLCLGYRMEEHERPGRFAPEKALALGIPRGPLWSRLQKGEPITLANGAVITPDKVLGPPRRGRHVAYVVDTRPTKSIYRLCKDADMAFVEGMLLPEDSERADEKGHMSIADSARIARRAGAARAVLIHLSPRYTGEDLDRLNRAAKDQFDNAVVGNDLDTFSIPLPD